MKLFLLFTLLISMNSNADMEFFDIKMSDGEYIQACANFPDSERFPGPRPVIMLIQGSGLHNSCHKKKSVLTEIDKLINELGVVVFFKQKRGLRTDPRTGEFYSDLNQYQEITIQNLKTDALDALSHFIKDPRINSKRVALWGGSEGTVLATYIASYIPSIFEVNLVSSMVESFEKLFKRQLDKLLPSEFIKMFNKDSNSYLSSKEISDEQLNKMGLLGFSEIDSNFDDKIDFSELAQEFIRAADFSLAQNDNSFFMSKLFSVGVRWVKSAYEAIPLGPQIQKLAMPVYIFHGEKDIHTSVTPVKKLYKEIQSKGYTNFKFNFFESLDHSLSQDIIISTLKESAKRISR